MRQKPSGTWRGEAGPGGKFWAPILCTTAAPMAELLHPFIAARRSQWPNFCTPFVCPVQGTFDL
eukprot:2459021-Pyramimonas_sp.AAC.1